MTKILLDMNEEEFQNSLFNLEKQEQRALLNTLRKITKLNWKELYQDKGYKMGACYFAKNYERTRYIFF